MPQDTETKTTNGAAEAKDVEQARGANGNAGNRNGGSNLGRGVAAALAAAAVGTAVAAAARSRNSGGGGEGGERPAGNRRQRARGAVKKSEPFLSAAWLAAGSHMEPHVRDASRRVGQLIADHSPDFVHENVIPPLVEGLTEGR